MFNPSLKVVVADEAITLVDFIQPHKCDELKCTRMIKLWACLIKWQNALQKLIDNGRRPDDALIENSLKLLVYPVANAKYDAMQFSGAYPTWTLMYAGMLKYAEQYARDARAGAKQPKVTDEEKKKKEKERKKKEEARKKKEDRDDPPDPNPHPIPTPNPP